jgi:hypothetical protein
MLLNPEKPKGGMKQKRACVFFLAGKNCIDTQAAGA